MADKQITVAVPEARVPEFYSWFAHFLAAESGSAGQAGFGPRGMRGRGRGHGPGFGPGQAPEPWTAEDTKIAAWLYGKLAPQARELFDRLLDSPGERFAGNELAAKLGLEKGAHGVAGILAWPGRYSRKVHRELPIATEGREDGGTDYFMDADVAKVFEAARRS